MSGPSSSGKTRRGRRKREPGDGVLFMVLRPLFLPHTNAHPPHTCLPLLSALSAHTHRYRTLTWPFRKAYLRTADEAAAGVTYALVSRDFQNAGGRLVSDGRFIEMSSKGSDPKLGTKLSFSLSLSLSLSHTHTHTHTHAHTHTHTHTCMHVCASHSIPLCLWPGGRSCFVVLNTDLT